MSPTSATKPILLITGAMAAGKSSVAQKLAEQLDNSVHLRGDVFRRMMVNGQVEMSGNPSPEAMRQLMLRYQAAANTAQLYSESGFNVVYQDVIVGPVLKDVVSMYGDHPLHVVVLCPSPATIIERENARAKTGYGEVSVDQLQDAVNQTPRLGFWIDTSEQSLDDTVAAILQNLDQARISTT